MEAWSSQHSTCWILVLLQIPKRHLSKYSFPTGRSPKIDVLRSGPKPSQKLHASGRLKSFVHFVDSIKKRPKSRTRFGRSSFAIIGEFVLSLSAMKRRLLQQKTIREMRIEVRNFGIARLRLQFVGEKNSNFFEFAIEDAIAEFNSLCSAFRSACRPQVAIDA